MVEVCGRRVAVFGWRMAVHDRTWNVMFFCFNSLPHSIPLEVGIDETTMRINPRLSKIRQSGGRSVWFDR